MDAAFSLPCHVPPVTQRAFACALRGKIKRRQPLNILLAEDDPSDVMLTKDALDRTTLEYSLQTVENGGGVMACLQSGKPLPDLILLDLTLPGKDGFEIMEEIRRDTAFRRIPIVILTGAERPRVSLPDSLWLADYVTKPATHDKIPEALGRLHSPC